MTGNTPSSAAEWVARINAGALSPDMQAALDRWLNEDIRNQADFTLARLTWSVAKRLNTSEEARKELLALKKWSYRDLWIWQIASEALHLSAGYPLRLAAAAALAISLVAGGTAWLLSPQPHSDVTTLGNGDSALTAIGEISSYVLPDGSKVTVNADSGIRVAFTRDRRQIYLERGQAFFDVKHDTARPFAVTSGSKTVVVTGTKFDVEFDLHRGTLEVAVVDGHVNVDGDETTGSTALEANDVFAFPPKGPPTRLTLAANLVSAWQSRRLYFEDTTIGDVLFSVNRFAPKRLQLADPKLADLPLSGMFVAGDIDAVLFSLNVIHGIEATDGGDILILHK